MFGTAHASEKSFSVKIRNRIAEISRLTKINTFVTDS